MTPKSAFRRLLHVTRSGRAIQAYRPDLRVAQLERRCEVLEGLVINSTKAERAVTLMQNWLSPVAIEGEIVRIGSQLDGGYVIPKSIIENARGAVSIGVGQNIDAERELVGMGLPTHAWDHTVARLPKNSNGITFHQVGIRGHQYTENCLSFAEILDISFPNGDGNLIVMMDVEGSEWDSLLDIPAEAMERVDVLTIEMHRIGNLLNDESNFVTVFETIRKSHFPISVSANNFGAHWKLSQEIEFPDVIEVTFVRNGTIAVSKSQRGNVDRISNTEDLPVIDISWLNRKLHDSS